MALLNSGKKKGIFYIVCSAFFFALMLMFVRLSGDLPSMQKAFFRNFVAMFFALFILIKDKIKFSGKKENIKYLFLRSFIGVLGIIGNFYAVDHLVLSDASILNKMSPFFAIVFSYFIVKEKVHPIQMSIITTAFLGSMLVVKPSVDIFQNPASLAGLIGGICAGFAYACVRKLGENGEKGPFVVFFFSAFSCLCLLPFLIFDFHPMTLKQLIFLLLAGLSAAGGQFTITAAYFHAPAREISVYDYSQLIFTALLGFFVFGQIPDLLSVIGYIVIVAMAILMFLYNNGHIKLGGNNNESTTNLRKS